MPSKLHQAFDAVQADQALRDKTAAYVERQRQAQRRPQARRGGRWLASLSLAALLFFGVGLYQLAFSASAYVSLDVNPSLELTLNRLNRVIEAYAFNEEAAQLLATVNPRGLRYDDATNQLLTALEAEGYLTEQALIAVTVQSSAAKREEALCQTLQTTIDSYLPQAELEVYPVSAETHRHAHGNNLSPARYLAIQELMAVDETATMEEYSHHSLQEIRHCTQLGGDNPTGGGSAGGGSGGNGEGSGNGGSGHGRGGHHRP